MTEEEYFPLRKNGDINSELMSFAKLYLNEIVETILDGYDDTPIDKFLEAIDATDVQLPKPSKGDVEWLVSSLLSSKKGFPELYFFLQSVNLPLFNQITLRDESGLYKDVVDSFKEYFLCEAADLVQERLEDILDDIVVDSDDENFREMIDSDAENDDSVGKPTVAVKEVKKGVYQETVLDRIAPIFDPEFAYSSLVRAYSVLKDVTDPLNTHKKSSSMRYGPWARAILRELPRMAPDKEEIPGFPSVVYKFAHACENDPINRVVIMYLLPDYPSKLDARNATIRARHEKDGIKLDMVTEVITTCRDPEKYADLRKASIYDYQTIAMPINLREYQKELVEKANTGENTVIVAPTGSGKTVVAAQIMRHHAMQKRAGKKPCRMIMVVPKIPLVEQQLKQLHQYMSDVVYSTYVHGDMVFEEQGKIEKILCAELVVMTAQILINLLESVRATERLFVSDMTMLILDECHHCCSNHPYAQLMTIIRNWEHDKPQIVGLTASLGVGKDGTLQESSAYDHVVSLLARMTAKSITTVVIHEKELQLHVQLPVDDIKDVRMSTERIPEFTASLTNYMNLINTSIRSRLLDMSQPTNKSGALIPKSLVHTKVNYHETEKYGGRIEAIKQAISKMNDGTEKSHLNMALDILKVCNMTWGMNDLLPSSTVWLMMKNEMHALKKRNAEHPFIKDFYDVHFKSLEAKSEEEDDCDMLKALRKELEDQMEKNRNSKVIIFVSTREMSKALSDYINDRKQFIKHFGERDCDFIISSKARGVGTVSQSPRDQKEALDKFRNNKLAVLVATTVAEEGLDVPECNLIIKYNMTGNVISLTQQRGRARARDSRSVLIVLSGSVKKRELENANAEKMMNHIVRTIRAGGGDKLERAIVKRREEMKRQLEAEERELNKKKEQLKANTYEVLCGNCNEVLCDSYRIKQGASHYFACDTQIWNSVKVEYADLKGKYIDTSTTVVGKVICTGNDDKCGQDLGKVVRFWSCYLPSLKCVSLALKNKKTNKIEGLEQSGNKKKNWSEVATSHFYISKISDTDVSEMMNALSQHNVQLFELLESKCGELLLKSRRDAQRKYELRKDEEEVRGAESD